MRIVVYNVGMQALRILALTALIFTCECISLAQDSPAPSVLDKSHIPPDLIHIERVSCILAEYGVQNTLNAHTGLVEHEVMWRVEPFATYDDHRDRWELPAEKLPTTGEVRPGAISTHKTSGAA